MAPLPPGSQLAAKILAALFMLILASLLAAVPVWSAAAVRPDEVAIAGVRIGMTANDALVRLRSTASAVRILRAPCVRDYILAKRAGRPMEEVLTNCIVGLLVTKGQEHLHVTLVEDFPSKPGATVVTSVSLSSFSPSFPAGSADVLSLIASLGVPSLTDRPKNWTIAIWCSGVCSSIQKEINDPRAAPYVYLRRGQGGGLTLMAQKYDYARYLAMRSYLAKQGIVLR